MQSLLKKFISFVDTLNETVGKFASWITTALMLLVVYDVIVRKLNLSSPWIMELEWHLFALIFLFGAAYAFKHDRHVRVDLFYTKFSEREKAWVNLLGGVLFLVPWCLVIIYTSYFFALDAYQIGEGSPNPGGLNNRYLIKAAITIGISLLLLQTLAIIFRSILTLKKNGSLTNHV